jgi:protein TonB
VNDAPGSKAAALLVAVRDASRRRKLTSLGIALVLEALILLLLLTLGASIAGVEDGKEAVTTFKAVEFAAPPAPEPETADAASEADTPQDNTPVAQQPVSPSPLALNPQPAPPQPPAPPQAAPEVAALSARDGLNSPDHVTPSLVLWGSRWNLLQMLQLSAP